MTRRILIAIVFPIAFAHAWAVAFTGCGGSLTPAEQASVAQDGIQMATCAASAHLCKKDQPDGNYSPCWAEFDACMTAHGFADAGVDAQGDR